MLTRYRELLKTIEPISGDLRPAAQAKMDGKTKPLGALGRLEELAIQLSAIQNSLNPRIHRKAMFVFAADHGVAEEGVSAFPPEVTAQMVANFLGGGAAINVLCRHNGIDLKVVDMGVNADLEAHPNLIQKKVRKGTRNFTRQPAMTENEMVEAVENGISVFLEEYERQPIDIVGLGEMGIANTTSASAIISAITGISVHDAAGRGTGVDDGGLQRKMNVIEKALDVHQLTSLEGMEVLRRVGGYEIAGIVGAIFAAVAKRTAVVLDGVISTAAGLVACKMLPEVSGYLIAGHRSVEKAQLHALRHMGIEPMVDFQMRLGEGTGAAMAIDVVDAACRIMREMASFEEAGVSNTE